MNDLFLRNYPDDDALKNPKKYSKALAFTPDIIPLYGKKVDHDDLVHPTAWRGFNGMPIVGGDVNNVYIRAHGSGGPHLASLRAFPNELILWPHIWSAIRPVSSGPVVIPGGDDKGPRACHGHLQFRPPHTTGNAYSLVANIFKHDPAYEHKSLHEYEPMPTFDPKNFGVDDLLAFHSKDKNFTFYNVIVADPTLKHISASTRLRMFGKSPVPASIRFEWHKGAPIPEGLEVSVIDDRGKITIPRTPLISLAEFKVVLEPGYDAVLTLHIFSPEEHGIIEPYSSLSLQVFKSGGLLGSSSLLGSLNIIFEPHATRNLRHASPSATQLREYKSCPKDGDCHCPPTPPKPEDCPVIPVTKPAATGWWFRGALNSPNHFPTSAPGGYTPDIQPIGTNLTVPGLWKALQDPNTDYSKDHSIELVGGEDNYIFVRGHSTIADIDIQSRIFAVMGAPVLHPKEWSTQSISAQVFDGSGPIDNQSISVADANQFYLCTRPFDIKAPPNPHPGSNGGNWMALPHFCLIAEVRQKRKCALVFPDWPSDQVDDFKTGQDFTTWIASNPLVCYRNVGWVPGTRKPGEKCLTWQCATRLVIPDSTFTSTFWTIIVECDNSIIPPGSKWSLTCDDNAIFPEGVCFGNTDMSVDSPARMGCHFTGATPGHAPSNLILTVTWCDGAWKIPPPSVHIKFAVTEVSKLTPIAHLAKEPHADSDTWPFYVASKYPYVGNEPNPSPLPSFTATGLNTWPYPGSAQFIFGQVSLAGKSE